MAIFFDRWSILALYVSTGPILVLAQGLAGVGSAFTAAFVCGTTLALLLLGRWREFEPNPADILFCLFVGGVAVSTVIHGIDGDRREAVLLLLSLAAYPAGRLFRSGKETPPRFMIIIAAIVLVGTVASINALVDQWQHPFGKPHPLMFGRFGAAPAQFTLSLGFLMIAVGCTRRMTAPMLAAAFLLAIPVAMFAASFVRFTFVAIGFALAGATVFGARSERWPPLTMLCVLVVGLVLGTVARLEIAPRMSPVASSATSATAIEVRFDDAESVAAGSGSERSCPPIDIHNSIAIRKQLYSEAFALLPSAGFFGIGMNRFMPLSCVPDVEIHNTILQAFIEFGWVAGVALALLALFAVIAPLSLVRHVLEARLAACGLLFTGLLTIAHGRISRDALLFFFIGYAASFSRRALHLGRSRLSTPS
ncbi:hypothetical protein ACFQX9_37920 [Bradyrhizobium sp. GCM10028915]|uniref:hypothetical protein n=1 Tax=Bradyrhizobium sp. GCM10028915 TaxID=3273385 RepID=UPI00361BEFE6